MHHLDIGRWYANFNGDFSGDIEIGGREGQKYSIPFYVLAKIVAEKIRREQIAKMENATLEQLLGYEVL